MTGTSNYLAIICSNVVSAHTAYIAIDENQHKTIEGALQTWDLSASGRSVYHMFGSPAGGARGGVPCCAAAPSPKGGAFMGMLKSKGKGNFCFLQLNDFFNVSTLTPGARRARKAPLKSMAMDSAPPPPMLSFSAAPPPPPGGGGGVVPLAAAPPPAPAGRSAGPFTPSSSPLSQLITLQQAEGYWKMDESLAKILSYSVVDLKSKCPVDCSSSVELLWATMLALVMMEEKFAGQRDEWELVAMKTEMWLQSQPLPPATPTLDSFKQAAKSCV